MRRKARIKIIGFILFILALVYWIIDRRPQLKTTSHGIRAHSLHPIMGGSSKGKSDTKYIHGQREKAPGTGPNTRRDKEIPIVYHDEVAKLLEQLNVSNRNCKSIPRIIHQTWKNEQIPKSFQKYVESWIKLHPDWQYWFWTDSIADQFIKLRFPAYHHMYKTYSQGIQRADAIRYFILYTFGGLYADLDMEALHPFDQLLTAHSAMIPEDHPAHININVGRQRVTTLNALMMSTPGHKYFRKIIEYLPKANKETGKGDVLTKTGPFMTDKVLEVYKTAAEPEGDRTVSICDSVYFASYSRFIPDFDALLRGQLIKRCKNPGAANTPKRRTCDMMKRKNFTNLPHGLEVMSNHVFHHTYYAKAEYKLKFTVSNVIKNIYNISKHIENMPADKDFAKLVFKENYSILDFLYYGWR